MLFIWKKSFIDIFVGLWFSVFSHDLRAEGKKVFVREFLFQFSKGKPPSNRHSTHLCLVALSKACYSHSRHDFCQRWVRYQRLTMILKRMLYELWWINGCKKAIEIIQGRLKSRAELKKPLGRRRNVFKYLQPHLTALDFNLSRITMSWMTENLHRHRIAHV